MSDIVLISLKLPCCFFCPSYLSTLSEIKMFILSTRGWDPYSLFQELKQVVLLENCNWGLKGMLMILAVF